MRSVDTNVLTRYVVQDDPVQSPIATRFLADHPCYVSDTVLLETAWLLSSHFGIGRRDLAETLRDIVELPNVSVSDRAMIDWAIERFVAGADLADMIHIVAGRHTDGFVSFETKLAKLAGEESPIPVERLG